MFKVNKIFFKENNYFIQQGCIKLIKSDSKDILMLQKISNKCCSNFLFIKNPEKKHQGFHKNIKQ